MRRPWAGVAALCLLLSPAEARASPRRPDAALERILPTRLRVTQGAVHPEAQGRFRVEEPRLRAVAAAQGTGGVSELRLRYLGPTRVRKALASGEQREQLGLKLRARDGCNVVYVMWRISPRPGLVVSVKHNPGEHGSTECGNRGYTTVRPRRGSPVPAPAPGGAHVLRAELEGASLRVQVDGVPVWEGTLPAEALSFDGPVGVRTDNVRAELELLTSSP